MFRLKVRKTRKFMFTGQACLLLSTTAIHKKIKSRFTIAAVNCRGKLIEAIKCKYSASCRQINEKLDFWVTLLLSCTDRRDAISPNPPRVGVFRNYSRFSDFAPSAALKFRKISLRQAKKTKKLICVQFIVSRNLICPIQ